MIFESFSKNIKPLTDQIKERDEQFFLDNVHTSNFSNPDYIEMFSNVKRNWPNSQDKEKEIIWKQLNTIIDLL